MGFRFRRSFKVAPGIRLNLSKRGLGVSLGVRGARVSLGADGKVRRTVGLPGTGLSYTTTSSMGNSAPEATYRNNSDISSTQISPQLVEGLGIFLDCVVGEPTYAGQLAVITGEHGVTSGSLETVAALNLQDGTVSVVIAGGKVGRINKDQSEKVRSLCESLALTGKYPTVRAKISNVDGQWQVFLNLP